MFFSSNSSVPVPTTTPSPTPSTGISGFRVLISILSLFRFLFSPTFWSKLGFFVSYVLTFLLVLEIVRLASTDANRKEVERMLDAYSARRSEVPVRRRSPEGMKKKEMMSVNIEELDNDVDVRKNAVEMRSVNIDLLEDMAKRNATTQEGRQRTRTPSPAVTRMMPESERSVDREERRRRRAASTSIAPKTKVDQDTASQQQTSTPPRRLRKRSDTLNSASSAESKSPLRRRREASPAESKASSRHASPTPRSKETKVQGSSLSKMVRSRA
jgi:hypothetical protein